MKNFLFASCFGLIFALAGSSAQATTWVFVGESPVDKVYVDSESVVGKKSGPKEVWTKTESISPDCMSDYPRALRKCSTRVLLYERHFKDKTFCAVQAVFYFTDGTTQGFTDDCRPKRVVPDSVPDAVWKYVYKPQVEVQSPQIQQPEP